jgi:hypothetical protein
MERYRQQEAQRRHVDEQYRQMFFEAREAYDTLKRTRRRLQDDFNTKHPTPQQVGALLANDAGLSTLLIDYGRALFDPQLALEARASRRSIHRICRRRTSFTNTLNKWKRANRLSDALRAAPTLAGGDLDTISGFLSSVQFDADFKRPYTTQSRFCSTDAA